MPTTEDVFKAGGQPTFTYVERDNSMIDRALTAQIKAGHKLMTVVGPSKTGKTVLVRKVVSDQAIIWVSGGEVRSETDFWDRILYGLEVKKNEVSVVQSKTRKKSKYKIGAGLTNLFEMIGIKGGYSGETEATEVKMTAGETIFHAQRVAVDRCRQEGRVIIIDDFHFIKKDVQTDLLRALKTPIFDGLKVIVLAVPHRGFDVERAEGDFDGRVARFKIEDWNVSDLGQIATKGFDALNVSPPGPLPRKLAAEAQGNPLIMQSLCLMLCQKNAIEQSQPESRPLKITRYDAFFSELAEKEGDANRQLIVKARRLGGVSTAQLEEEVLAGISECLPVKDVPLEDIREAMRGLGFIRNDEAIVDTLKRLSRAAEGNDNAPAPFEWNEDSATLHIINARFAYFAKWGAKARA